MKSGIFIFNFFALATAIDFSCTFIEGKWNISYTCEVENLQITSMDDRDLALTSSTHTNHNTNSEVQFFNVEEKIVNFFPKKLHEIFPKIDTIRIYSCELKEIKSEDLKPFGEKLKNLWIDSNEIEKLEADLFVNNPKLDTFVVKDNQLVTVEDGTFKNIPQLSYLDAFNNPCYSATVYGKAGVKKAGLVMEKRCKDTRAEIFEYFEKKISELRSEIDEKCKKE